MDKRRQVWEQVLGWRVVKGIYESHSGEEEKLHTCANNFACKPEASWRQLVQELYAYSEMAAAKEAKGFLQQKGGWFIGVFS